MALFGDLQGPDTTLAGLPDAEVGVTGRVEEHTLSPLVALAADAGSAAPLQPTAGLPTAAEAAEANVTAEPAPPDAPAPRPAPEAAGPPASATAAPPATQVIPPPAAPESPAAAEAGCDAVIAATGARPPVGWTVSCRGPVPGVAAEANPTSREILLYIRNEWSVTEAARVLAHELGHAYDWALLDDADRQAWMDARGLRGDWGSWCPPGAVCGDTDRPAGDWAEAVGEVLVPGTDMWCSELGPVPTPEQLEVARRILTTRGVLA